MTNNLTLAGFARLAFAAGALALTVSTAAPAQAGEALVRICSGGVVRFIPFGADEEPGAPGPSGGCHAVATLRQADKRLIRPAT